MKTKLFSHIFLLCLLVIYCTSCSKDDDKYEDPVGTASINMLNEDNGKTELGNSDVYIDKANNFLTSSWLITSLGQRNGLGNVSGIILKGANNNVAVELGNAYQIFKQADIFEFPSGRLALNIGSHYYTAYIQSQIEQSDVVVGANVKFVVAKVPNYELPGYNSNIGTLIYIGDNRVEQLIIDLSSSDFEYDVLDGANVLQYEKKGNKLIVSLIDFVKADTFGIYIRIQDSYTYVSGTVCFE